MTEPGRLRVVQVVNTTEHGGVEEHVRELSVGLAQRGDLVTLVCPPTPVADRLATSAAAAGIAVERARLGTDGGPRAAMAALRELTGIVRRARPDVLHVHLPGYTGGRLAVLAGRISRARAITCTAHLAPSERAPLHGRAARLLLHLGVDRFIGVSEHSLQRQVRYLGQPRSRSAVVHNGVDIARFSGPPDRRRIREELGLPVNAPVLGSVARLAPQKSLETLVEALPGLIARRPDLHAVIVGDGPLREQLTLHAARLGVADRLHLTGFRSDVARCLGAFDVFVLTSVFEGLPISILEAMASGLPVVATGVDGVPEAVVEGVTGHLVQPGEPAQIVEAVRSLLADPTRAAAMGAAGRDRARLHFSSERFITATRAQYEIALGAPSRRAFDPAAQSSQARSA